MQEPTGATTDGREHILPLLPHLRAYARSLSGGDVHAADDLVQDTVLLALRAWDRFTPGTNLRAWLFCILHNRSHTVRNRKRLSAEVGVGDIELHGSVPAVQERRADLRHFDLMAGPEAVAGKLGGLYAPAHELADVPDTPRRAFIAREDVTVPLAGVAGILTYVGATAAALGVVASGGALALALAAVAAGGVAAGGLGALIARSLGRERARKLEDRMALGGLVL